MQKRFISVERLERVAVEALRGGYGRMVPWKDRTDLRRMMEMDMAMDCQSPFSFELHARYSATHHKKMRPLTIVAKTRCRKCEACMERKAKYWMARAFTEYERSERTVFGTFTMAPEMHYQLQARAVQRLGRKGVNWWELSKGDQFAEQAREFGAEVSLWLKRVRKFAGPGCRYLLVAEAHEGRADSVIAGFPHYHILLHEQKRGQLVAGNPAEALINETDGEWLRRWKKDRQGRWQATAQAADDSKIRKAWTLGFTKFEWASSPQAAIYLCKYISKSMQVRVRASFAYGRIDTDGTRIKTSNRPSPVSGDERSEERK